MRLPKVGELGWQAKTKSRGWVDVDILAGPFYSPKEYEQEMRMQPEGIDGDEIFPIFNIRSPQVGEGWSGMENLRRKPEQKDNQACDASFMKDLRRWMNREVKA